MTWHDMYVYLFSFFGISDKLVLKEIPLLEIEGEGFLPFILLFPKLFSLRFLDLKRSFTGGKQFITGPLGVNDQINQS